MPIKVNLKRWRRRGPDDPNDPYQHKRCGPCAKDDHNNCDHHINDSAVDALDFLPVSCTCQCNDEDLLLMESHVGVKTDRTWSSDLDSTKVTLTLAIPNLYLTQAIVGRDQDGNIIVDLEKWYLDHNFPKPEGMRNMTIEDLALLIGRQWEKDVRLLLINMIRDNLMKAPEEVTSGGSHDPVE